MIVNFTEKEKEYLIKDRFDWKVKEEAPKEVKKKLKFLIMLSKKLT